MGACEGPANGISNRSGVQRACESRRGSSGDSGLGFVQTGKLSSCSLSWRGQQSEWVGREDQFGFGNVKFETPGGHPIVDLRRWLATLGERSAQRSGAAGDRNVAVKSLRMVLQTRAPDPIGKAWK